MENVRFGGRYSNFIEDIKPPEAKQGLVPVREGINNFRPFEEVASNFVNTSPLPAISRKVGVSYSPSSIPISVGVGESRSFRYTYVPPLRTLDFGSSGTVLTDAFERIGIFVSDMVDQIGKYAISFAAFAIIRPYRAASNFLQNHLFTRKYSVDHGAGYRLDDSVGESAKSFGVAAFLIFGLLLFGYSMWGLLDNGLSTTKPGTHASQSAASGSNNSSTSNNQSASDTAKAQAATAAASAAGSGANASNSTGSSLLQGSSTLTGGRGGGTTSTGGSVLSNPADLIPYQTVTVPPTSVQLDGKQVIGTDGTTITTN